MAIDLHELRVAEFMRDAEKDDPERTALICALYPVKTARQLRTIAEFEYTAGLFPPAGAPIASAVGARDIERGSETA
jgi:hypothetical protein